MTFKSGTSKVFPSKFPGTCTVCGNRFGKGEMVRFVDNKIQHESCEPVMETMREVNAVKMFESQVEGVGVIDPFLPVAAPVHLAQSEFIPSKYQQAIFDAGASGTGNIVVNATAGSGKTRTIQEFIKGFIPASHEWIYLVFNKKNQVEASEKIDAGDNGSISTFHSFCLNNAIKQAYGKVKIEDKKGYLLLAQLDPMKSDKDLWSTVVKVAGLIKNTLTDWNNYDALVVMCDHYGVELNGSAARVLELARDLVEMSKSNTAMVDFDDMLWLTIINNLPLPKFDYVLVDETQDLNAVQIDIVLRIRKESGRTIAIGDENQAIYGFRGADADAMDKVISALQATTLPLSLCYRNPRSVVRLVNETLPAIKHECLPDAPEGEVLTIKQQDLGACVKPGDMVICRTNAPLVKPAFDLIKRGIKASIMGRSIGEELVNLINRVTRRLPTDNLEFILAALSEYKQIEIMRLMNQGKESTAEALDDKVNTIYALAEGCQVLAELVKKAETIFSDDAKGVVFSSAHRAKGLEADHVFILKYELMPHPMAKQPWQMKQEENIKFVALTRSRLKLYFVQE